MNEDFFKYIFVICVLFFLAAYQWNIFNRWKVTLSNDDIHHFDEVALQIQKAIGCSVEMSQKITLWAHQKGKGIVFIGTKESCEKVMAVLKEINLTVDLERV